MVNALLRLSAALWAELRLLCSVFHDRAGGPSFPHGLASASEAQAATDAL
eukprot:CAMPEP_0172806320 /NCGR_PEP_ID=MMETSP1075-20121228/6283_1 /TAXON_ID=2916 /ORGANISM="Ceratium fusus, Strain PA161109" /LENGTH=49 /DNA_ID=CAMNT_0013645097 /DNA_START=34 /DNA_END=183 /DNA_ORIENTATION=-